MRLFLRITGIWTLLAAVVALTIDGTKSLAASEVMVTPLGEYWFQFHPDSLAALQAAIETQLHPLIWELLVVTLVQVPIWLLLGLLGVGIYWLGRPRRRIEVFSN